MARSVIVTLGANVSNFIAGMGQAASAAQSAAGRIVQSAQRNSAEWDTVGSSLTKVGAVAAAGLGLAAKAAMDWESAFAGVAKTVDQSSPAFAGLEGELRGMARSMAASHTEIAAVAEAAGALGVATEDVAGFTRTMIMLGETTNLTAEEAADSLAQFMNIMGTAPDQVGNLGAALVALGNDGASTERQIVQMAQRIAGAGRQIGLSEAEVMGFASALASVGIEVEAGGTAISSTMLKMEQAVRSGGAELETLARTAGMSSADFKRAFETDAAGAIQAFIEGLGRVQAAGGDVTGILTELGITGIREADALRRLALSGDMLANSLATANEAMDSGTALLAEYMVRAATTEARVQAAWNNIKDAAISAGQALLPMIAAAAQGFAAFAGALAQLPGPVQGFGVAVLGVVAAVGLVGGAVMKTVAFIVELRAALVALGAASAVSGGLSALGAGLAAVARRAAPVAIAVAALVVTFRALNQALKEGDAGYQMTRNLENLQQAILSASGAAKSSDLDLDSMFRFETGAVIKDSIEGIDDAMRRIADNGAWASFEQWTHSTGMATSAAGEARDRMLELDAAMAGMASKGQLRETAAAFDELAASSRRAGLSSEQLIDLFPQYADAARTAAEAMGATNLTADELVELMSGRVPASVRAAAEAAGQGSEEYKQLQDALGNAAGAAEAAAQGFIALANAQLALDGSAIAVERALRSAKDAIGENGRTLDETTEAGLANQEMLLQLAGTMGQYAKAQADAGISGDELARVMDDNRAKFIATAEAMGASRFEAEVMADRYGLVGGQVAGLAGAFQDLGAKLAAVPDGKQITVRGENMETVNGDLSEISAAIADMPDDKQIAITMPDGEVRLATVGELKASLESLPANTEAGVTAPGAAAAAEQVKNITWMIEDLPEYKSIQVVMPDGSSTYTTAQNLGRAIRDIPDDKDVTLTLSNGETATVTAGQVRDALGQINDRNVAINADPSGAVAGAGTAQGAIDATHGVTRDVDADPSGAISGSSRAQGAIDATHGVDRNINVTSDAASTASSAQASMNSVRNVTRTITINTVYTGGSGFSGGGGAAGGGGGGGWRDGGLIPASSAVPGPAWSGAQRLSVGGRVAGWSPHPRADNVPIWATAGEVMMSNWAGDRYGRDRLLAINSGRIDPRAFSAFMSAQGFADGGLLRPQRPATHAYAAAPVGSMGGVVHNTNITVNNPVTRSWAESVRQESALAAVGR